MRTGSRYSLLNRYLGREYILSFLVSFAFFFFIFFINQILVLAQKIILKNVSVGEMLILVALYIPQFLMYTMPFSSLTSASMVIGRLSSGNEILAMRSSGISLRHILVPILAISLLFSFGTYLIADYLIPFTAQKYRTMYGRILEKVPTIELESYSSTRFGNRVISNGVADGNILYDVLIFDDTRTTDSRVVWAEKAQITLVDLDRLVYRIDLDNPRIMITDSSSALSYSLSSASHMIMYLSLSANSAGYNPISPSQMSISELRAQIPYYTEENKEILLSHSEALRKRGETLVNLLDGIETNPVVETDDINLVLDQFAAYRNASTERPFSFYYQYYRAELHKKLALSAACSFLVLIAFPLSFFRMKYGRLTGFGLSMFAASLYWFALYFCHVRAVTVAVDPALLLWLPNFAVLVLGMVSLRRLSRP